MFVLVLAVHAVQLTVVYVVFVVRCAVLWHLAVQLTLHVVVVQTIAGCLS